jgi:hypothetical protein
MKTKRKKLLGHFTMVVPMSKKEVTAYAGEPCKDYDAGCPTCRWWDDWHSTQCLFLQVKRADVVALMMQGEI